ncbi:MAG: ribosomal protein S18 acetylase RimI-like enzyme [Psychromonas sp.]|uniref:GNAT family N-acetyltransferase n=1 Tax=Psychromonas sp. TaxID=1884585 RepID=UPI0039E5FEF0
MKLYFSNIWLLEQFYSLVTSLEYNVRILKAEKNHIPGIALIYKKCFPRESMHREWIASTYASFPRASYFIVEIEGEVVAYILWCFKNGFREQSILELEQIGVAPEFRGKGIAKDLIKKSFELISAEVSRLNLNIKSIIVTTREGNHAEAIYKSALGVERVALIKGYGSGDEVILLKSIETS